MFHLKGYSPVVNSFRVVFILEPCIDVNGTRVYNGDYQPGLDPCTTCSCHMGRKERCMSVACVPPPDCSNPKPIPGVCCEFTCPETDDIYDLEKRGRHTKMYDQVGLILTDGTL